MDYVDNGKLGSKVEIKRKKSPEPKGTCEPVVSSQRRTSAIAQVTKQREKKEEFGVLYFRKSSV